MADILTDVRFWLIALSEGKRTLVCSPDLESRVKGRVEAAGLAGKVKVEASRNCPEDKILIIDENALQASLNKSLQRERWSFGG